MKFFIKPESNKEAEIWDSGWRCGLVVGLIVGLFVVYQYLLTTCKVNEKVIFYNALFEHNKYIWKNNFKQW